MHRTISFDDTSRPPMNLKRSGELTMDPPQDSYESSQTMSRKRTRTMLEERLLRNSLNEHNGNDCCIDHNRIQRQAEAIEAALFKHQPSFDLVASTEGDDDRITNRELNRNLILLLGKIVERRRCRSACGGNGSACSVNNAPCAPRSVLVLESRQEALEACLGKDRYRQAQGILGTIQQLGIELTGQCYSRRPGRLTLPNGTMPEPVRRLFCETSLRTIMNRTPIAELHLQEWDKLLTQAERHLKEYLEWLAQCRKEQHPASSGTFTCGCRTKVEKGTVEEARGDLKHK